MRMQWMSSMSLWLVLPLMKSTMRLHLGMVGWLWKRWGGMRKPMVMSHELFDMRVDDMRVEKTQCMIDQNYEHLRPMSLVSRIGLTLRSMSTLE